ncbi:hypothetical protein EVAR_90410_1 [Eumeta japonica]|uniref:Uncharacterized protein n=1 Tax=Eumeta variegata TaxID=151549 RepID=A0A4C1YBJ4_EUMVA|nr:hypothetical protein EVAR_90410_1 [Eumeta japonica]
MNIFGSRVRWAVKPIQVEEQSSFTLVLRAGSEERRRRRFEERRPVGRCIRAALTFGASTSGLASSVGRASSNRAHKYFYHRAARVQAARVPPVVSSHSSGYTWRVHQRHTCRVASFPALRIGCVERRVASSVRPPRTASGVLASIRVASVPRPPAPRRACPRASASAASVASRASRIRIVPITTSHRAVFYSIAPYVAGAFPKFKSLTHAAEPLRLSRCGRPRVAVVRHRAARAKPGIRVRVCPHKGTSVARRRVLIVHHRIGSSLIEEVRLRVAS